MKENSKIYLKEAKRIDSPNFDSRPANTEINLLVIHSISIPPSIFNNNNVELLFTNKLDESSINTEINKIKDMKLSSHLYIKRNGELIQFVDLLQRAWHAGKSIYDGVQDCNNYSIGIELEGFYDIVYEDIQYEVLANSIKEIRKIFPKISKDRIVGHSDIASGRKIDPGPLFDWKRIKSMIWLTS